MITVNFPAVKIVQLVIWYERTREEVCNGGVFHVYGERGSNQRWGTSKDAGNYSLMEVGLISKNIAEFFDVNKLNASGLKIRPLAFSLTKKSFCRTSCIETFRPPFLKGGGASGHFPIRANLSETERKDRERIKEKQRRRGGEMRGKANESVPKADHHEGKTMRTAPDPMEAENGFGSFE